MATVVERWDALLRIMWDINYLVSFDETLALAEVVGGRLLAQAINPQALAPCAVTLDCTECQLSSVCRHRGKTVEVRQDELQQAAADTPSPISSTVIETPIQLDQALTLEDL